MALSDTSLRDRIINEMNSVLGAPADSTQLSNVALAIAKAVNAEIRNNAVVTVTGVTAGGANANGTIS